MSAIQQIASNIAAYPEIVRRAKEDHRYTNAMVSDLSGVSLSVVSKLMSGSGADPKLYDAAAICSVLGLSLDELFDLDRPPDDPNELLRRIHELELANAEQQLANSEQQVANAELKGQINVLQAEKAGAYNRMRDQRSVIYILICACVVLSFALAGYLFIDSRIADAGLIRWGDITALAWIMIALIIAAIVIIGWTIVRVVKNNN